MTLLTPLPALRDGDALERLLSSLEWEVRSTDRLRIEREIALGTGDAALVYVLEGALALPPRAYDCGARDGAPPTELVAGDTLLSLGREPMRIRGDGAFVIVSRLSASESVQRQLAIVPDLVSVSGFSRIEPAAAALAAHLGLPAVTSPYAGAAPVICRLMATTLALATLRAWAVAGCAPDGWPARTADPFLARVIEAIHAEPGRDWTVERMAAIAAMSRSVFAERFRSVVGRSPLGYLTEVRMAAAQDLLAGGAGVSEVSRRLGYASDEGFSRAFRRHTGVTPSAWRARALVRA
ncbi:helix-turn-helix transcriptional regulator [Microbacterium sp. KNMS]